MPTVNINGRSIEVEAGTNVIQAAKEVGVHIPHYCYHPRLSVVGQCRMCLVQVDGQPKLQAGCSMTVQKDGMEIRTDVPEVEEAQRAMMEFLLINHPLDCSICDQAGECGLQDYAFKHGQAFSRFEYEEKRTYPGRERIPLGPNVLLNMNRCIQCTRCVRFTREVSKTGSLGFFNRGARTEIGTFPGAELDDELSTNVVDICPVGALTSTRFRFAERVWNLTKEPSLCTGCEVGCNVTLEHRKGAIRRYKPRENQAVNDFWMCDYGRSTHERYGRLPRLASPRVRVANPDGDPTLGEAEEQRETTWREALDAVARSIREAGDAGGSVAVLGSADQTTEEAWVLAQVADSIGVGAAARGVHVQMGPRRRIPNPNLPDGEITGTEHGPNRRGAELAGLGGELDVQGLFEGDEAGRHAVLIVADSDLGAVAHDPEAVARLQQAGTLVVFGWADTPLSRAADVAVPLATHAEMDGTFVNVQHRVQRFDRAFPAPGQARPGVEAYADLLSRFDERWTDQVDAAGVFDLLAGRIPAFSGWTFDTLPTTGAVLDVPGASGPTPEAGDSEAEAAE